MSQPPCPLVPGKEEYVYRLFKALYGLKQAPRAWNEKMDQYLKQQGFIRSHADSNLYYKSEGGRLCVLVLYVDDLIITGNDLQLVECEGPAQPYQAASGVPPAWVRNLLEATLPATIPSQGG